MQNATLEMAQIPPTLTRRTRGNGYVPPVNRFTIDFQTVLEETGRAPIKARQLTLLRHQDSVDPGLPLFCAGDRTLLNFPAVSIVGTREVSAAGKQRAEQLARRLAQAGVMVVSGLARGVDAAAHSAAIECGGRTIAVIGTPLNKSYPAENARLQELIYRDHLLVSPFADNETVFKTNFPKRNRVMAALTDATAIIEASDTSGTLHQAAECQRLGRWLFIARSVAENPDLTWPKKFLDHPRTAILSRVDDILSVL